MKILNSILILASLSSSTSGLAQQIIPTTCSELAVQIMQQENLVPENTLSFLRDNGLSEFAVVTSLIATPIGVHMIDVANDQANSPVETIAAAGFGAAFITIGVGAAIEAIKDHRKKNRLRRPFWFFDIMRGAHGVRNDYYNAFINNVQSNQNFSASTEEDINGALIALDENGIVCKENEFDSESDVRDRVREILAR